MRLLNKEAVINLPDSCHPDNTMCIFDTISGFPLVRTTDKPVFNYCIAGLNANHVDFSFFDSVLQEMIRIICDKNIENAVVSIGDKYVTDVIAYLMSVDSLSIFCVNTTDNTIEKIGI